MKLYNQKLLLRAVMERGTASKSDLSKATQLTLPSVADIIDELETLNLVKNMGESKIKRGRYPNLYELNTHILKVVGVTIRSKSIRVGVFNLKGESLAYSETSLPNDTSPDNIIALVSLTSEEMITQTTLNREEIIGVGIGMHGIVDHLNGVAVFPPHLKWDHVPLKELLEEKMGLPILVDNDCNSLALAELWFGQGRELDCFITVNADYGVGAGIMINGQIFHGRNFGAGQIGHTIVKDHGPLCSCGNYGCLEMISSEISIVREIRTKLEEGSPSLLRELEPQIDLISTEHIYQAANQNDFLACTTLEKAAQYLGIGISTLINLFNPDKVILTGGLLKAEEWVLKPLQESYVENALKPNLKDLDIVSSKLGPTGEVLGAASLWINELFNGDVPFTELIHVRGADYTKSL